MRRWTREAIVAAIRDWHRRTGRWPTVTDWTPSRARAAGRTEALALYERGGYPSAGTVKRAFRYWAAAMEAAGHLGSALPYRRFAAPRVAEWTRGAIIAAIQRWADEHDGEPPSYQAWAPGMAVRRGRPDMAEEYYSGTWPPGSSVARAFGSWGAALRAAGFPGR